MRIAFQNLGGKCVFSSGGIDTLKLLMKVTSVKSLGDITKINEKDIPEHDILVAGFPLPGIFNRRASGGFEDTKGGTLFFDVARILKEKQPKAFFLENVKGLANHARGKTLKVILNTLRDDPNYYVPDPQIVNAKDFGVPQAGKEYLL